MDQDIPEGEVPLEVRGPDSQVLMNLSKVAKRFADYLELPFNAGGCRKASRDSWRLL
jgi:hypothetical protein